MGIRYYAYPVSPEDIDVARQDPSLMIPYDPLADAWSIEPPTMLYLDKCWRLLQAFSHPVDDLPRPCYDLFKGEVTMVDDTVSWRGYYSFLEPAEVSVIAEDLESITEAEIAAFTTRWGYDDYFREFLSRAQTFTRSMADQGLGIAYLIA